MKYYSCASYNCAAHEDGSHVAHEIELACSTRKLTLESHASSVQVTRQKYKNTRVLSHASVNLDMSGTVPFPKVIMSLIASSILMYLTEHNSLGIPSLKLWFLGCDKSTMSLYLLD